MCQSYRKPCACGQRTSEIFFGKMVLDEAAVRAVYCPACSAAADRHPKRTVEDNGWVLELDPEVLEAYAPRMEMTSDEVTAEKVFDGDYVTWVGFSPEDNVLRSREREQIAREFQGDVRGQFEALKKWAIEREKRFVEEGWRKAVRKKAAYT
ncbi:MAG: hypothetical protein Kow0092_23260 [Deferrisomatales bacterium]